MRRRRWLYRVFAIGLLLYAGLVAATARLFVWPPTPDIAKVDAVVILSGDAGDRMAGALALMTAGAAPVLVHAGTRDSQFAETLCQQQDPRFEVVCLLPNPDSTRAEARAVADLVRERGWDTIALVTSNFHATRAGITFRRCVDARVQVVPTPAAIGRRQLLQEVGNEWLRVGYLGVFQRSC